MNAPIDLPPWIRLQRDPFPYAEAARNYAPATHADEALRVFLPYLEREEVEVMMVLALDGNSRALGVQEVARGGRSRLTVEMGQLFRVACVLGASGIILAHNHPSGDCTPSADDHAITEVVAKAGELLRIPLMDHFIVAGRGNVYSFLADGKL